MFASLGFKLPNNGFWKYIVGSIIVIVASGIGQVPFMIAVFAKAMAEGETITNDTSKLMKILDPNLTLFLLMLSFVVALATLFLVVKHLHKQKILEVTTARPKVDWGRVFFSFGIWAIFSAVSVVAYYFITPEKFVLNFQPVPFLILFVIATLLIPVQTSTEEYIFRGYLMQGFALLAKNKWFPLVMTSVIFGGMHYFNPEVAKMGNIIMIYYIGTGFFLGIITLMDEGMELALGFHAANNLIGALLVTSDWGVFQTHSVFKDISEPSAGLDVLLPVLVIFPILLFIFSKKYKWFGWKEKLAGEIVEPINQNNQINKVGK
ncbi:CPBP family intramembrane metalloprotease [Flavobacterium sp. NST-5]|uniref:CPBP family intramembrane metalloprotease n=1 Tax=Flavobacterium ichthyis TaxID=2698827 RepID=A0ABW9Z8J2_9FLAO|nr:CPBP family intramembrane glutamic endopeptidase [Flavobacterium ichthyis]NBL64159.1 CPBP family intramembrane metalloprotease [Flavobacterium ichthyis]